MVCGVWCVVCGGLVVVCGGVVIFVVVELCGCGGAMCEYN